jgi:outer membrane protein TolC
MTHRRWICTVTIVFQSAAGLAAWTGVGHVQPADGVAASRDFAQDAVLTGLIREAIAHRPELAQAQTTARAELERIPQASALPDPVLSGGIQNDGFSGLQIGKTETSWWSLAAAQTLPWFGKRELRRTSQTLAARASEADLDRARLSVQADVERGYLDLLLAHDQLRILDKLEGLWAQAEGLARARYESGQGAQVDILRSQLERGRLMQQRAGLIAEERRRVAILDRAVGRTLDQPIDTPLSLGDLSDPALPDSSEATADLEARSPELRRAELTAKQANTLTSLAQKELYPDLTVSGGVMPRGGQFEPMWQAGVSLTLPLWAGGKQSHAVSEYRLRGEAAQSGAEVIRRALLQRLEERRAVLIALRETNRLYRTGLLVQSEATVSSAMAQYQVGRAPFASVLESLGGYLSDLVGYYESVAAAQRIDIAQRELSLDAVAGSALGGLAGAPMPGTSGMGGAAVSAPPTTVPQPAVGSGATAMPRM